MDDQTRINLDEVLLDDHRTNPFGSEQNCVVIEMFVSLFVHLFALLQLAMRRREQCVLIINRRFLS